MTMKKGSLIRRLAQDRRDKTEESASANGLAVAVSLGGLLASEKPAPAVPAMTMAPAPEPARPAEIPSAAAAPLETLHFETPAIALAGKGADELAQPPMPGKAPGEKRPNSPRLARLPGRQRRRHGDACVRHPGETKRNAGARAWLTPEESEKLELLAVAYQVTTSTLTREIIIEGLEAHADLIEKTRKFLESLGRGRVGA